MPLDREQLEVFLESAPDAMLVVDGPGRVVLANSQANELFGATDNEGLEGSGVDDLVPERFRPAHEGHRGRFAEHPSARSMGAGLELYARRCDGTEFPVDISLSPLPGRSGPLVLCAVRDQTLRKASEERLARARMVLEQRADLERHALEINDTVVQGLSVAKYALDHGHDEQARAALSETLAAARTIITDLLGERGGGGGPGPGDLRRSTAATFGSDAQADEDAGGPSSSSV